MNEEVEQLLNLEKNSEELKNLGLSPKDFSIHNLPKNAEESIVFPQNVAFNPDGSIIRVKNHDSKMVKFHRELRHRVLNKIQRMVRQRETKNRFFSPIHNQNVGKKSSDICGLNQYSHIWRMERDVMINKNLPSGVIAFHLTSPILQLRHMVDSLVKFWESKSKTRKRIRIKISLKQMEE